MQIYQSKSYFKKVFTRDDKKLRINPGDIFAILSENLYNDFIDGVRYRIYLFPVGKIVYMTIMNKNFNIQDDPRLKRIK